MPTAVQRLTAIEPLWAVEGGQVNIHGSGFPMDRPLVPEVKMGDTPARVVFASSAMLRVLVPAGLEGGATPVRVEDAPGETAFLEVGTVFAAGLHQIDNPVFDREGNLYVTYSGTRGQEVPVSIFRVSRDGRREPFVSGVVNPTSMAFDREGNLYVSSRFEGTVYRVSPDGGREAFATDLGVPCGLAFAGDGSLFVGDRSGTLFRVHADGTAKAVAMLPASVAAFHLAVGPDEAVYVTAPTLGPYDHVYRVDPRDGSVERVYSGFGRPQGLAFDSQGTLYVIEALAGWSGLYRIRADGAPELVLSAPALVGVALDPQGGIVVSSNDIASRLQVGLRPAMRDPESRSPNPDPGSPDAQLVRAIGLRQLTASIINVTIGAGIFVLPATVAAGLGPAAPFAYLACAALMALIVVCFSAAGSRVSLTGGLYAYIDVAFGGYVGFIGGVLYWLTACFSVASVATALTGSLGGMWPPAGVGGGRMGVLVVLFGALALVNVRGVKPGVRLVEVVTLAKLLPLLLLVGTGLWAMNPQYLRTSIPAASQVGNAAILLIFAFVGIEVALVPSGEVRDPARTVPRAALLALMVTTVIYLAVQAVAQGVLGPSLAEFPDAPLAETAGRVLGASGRVLVLAGATVSMFGYVSGDMLGTPRALFALGRDGMLPAALARVHPRFHTPAVAISVYAFVVTVLAISGSFAQLAILANVAALSLYLLCVAAAFELQRRDVRMAGAPFALPGGPAIPALAAAGIVWMLSHATRREFEIEALVLAIATGLYFFRRRRRP